MYVRSVLLSLCGLSHACNLFLAPSTLKGAGLGIFTGIPLREGQIVGHGDICIPVLDNYELFSRFEDYPWDGNYMGMGGELEKKSAIIAYCAGFDSAINCHYGLENVGKATPEHDVANLHRSRDPGVGGYTPYWNLTTQSYRDLPAGAELFKSYGDYWFEHRAHRFDGPLPMKIHEYDTSEDFLKKWTNLTSMHCEIHNLTRKIAGDVWNSRLGKVGLASSCEEAQEISAKGYYEHLLPSSVRDIEWLQTHGRCLDNIRTGQSTITQAAHGAFATRDLQSGTIITSSPVHHIPDRSIIDSLQLLLNYCFGHKETTMLLCPFVNGVNLINHNQSQANVRLEWSLDFDLGTGTPIEYSLSNMTVADLEGIYRPVLSLDYIATRDIARDEELFLDYGDAWELAWKVHEQSFSPRDPNYLSARDCNRLHGHEILPTTNELLTFPSNLELRCHPDLCDDEDGESWAEYDFEWTEEIYGRSCEILERYYDNTYQVQISWEEGEHTWNLIQDFVSRQGIRFFDVPGTTDLHLQSAFRHEMGLPDRLLPKQWRNLLPLSSTDEDVSAATLEVDWTGNSKRFSIQEMSL